MDGVLADTTEFHYQSWRTALSEHGLALERERFLQYFGRTPAETQAGLLRDLPGELILEIRRRKEELFNQTTPGNVRSTPGVLAWLERFSIRCPQAVASSAPVDIIETLLEDLGIRGYFQAIISGSLLQVSKPDPAIFLIAAKELGVEPRRCLVIEDSPSGIEAARTAGIPVIAICTSNPAKNLLDANLVLANLTELREEHLSRLGLNRTT